MDISCGITLSIKRVANSHARNVLWALAGTLAASVIVIGSLGSIQNQCRFEDPALLAGINGFSDVLSCKKLYRYYWFITALNFVTGFYGVWMVARGFLTTSRGAVLGLLTIANLLTINMTDAFLSIVDVPKFTDGPARDRARTMIAGCIITAFFQAVSIILVGYCPNAVSAEPEQPVEKANKTKEAPKEAELVASLPAEPQQTAAPVPEPAPAAAEPAPAPAVVPDVEAPAAPEQPAVAPAEAVEEAPKEAAVAVAVQ